MAVFSSLRVLVLLGGVVLFSACGDDSAAAAGVAEADPTTSAPATAPATDAFVQVRAQFEDATTSIASLRAALLDRFPAVSDPETGTLNPAASQEFIELSEQLAGRAPAGDTLAALPLYRAAEVASALGNPRRAAALYERIHTQYPTFHRAPESLFMLAFTYDEYLNDLTTARRYYEEFLENYPENGFADDTEVLLRNLGKSDAEILEELEAGGR